MQVFSRIGTLAEVNIVVSVGLILIEVDWNVSIRLELGQ